MDAATQEFVRQRAGNRCEYGLLRQEQTGLTHHVDCPLLHWKVFSANHIKHETVFPTLVLASTTV